MQKQRLNPAYKENTRDIEPHRRREISKIAVIALLVIAGLVLAYYYHVSLGFCALFCHLFYLPAILAAFWWRGKGLIVALLLAGTLAATHLFPGVSSVLVEDYIRAVILIAVSAVVAFLSERAKKEERALRESEARYRALFSETANPILVIDKTGGYVAGNEAALQFLECPLDELLSKNVRDFIPPGTPPGGEDSIIGEHKRLWECGGTLETEYYINGKIKVLELTITPAAWQGKHVVFGIGKDVSERKRMEQALRESEAKFQDMYSNAPVACFSVGPDGLLMNANKEAERFVGYQLNELLGMSVTDLYSEESQARARQLLDRLRRGESWENEEVVYRRKDGQECYGLLSVSPVRGEGGQVIESHSVVVDITERKRAEEQQRLAGAVLALLNQSEDSRETISSILHLVNESTGIEAVGIRLHDGEDYPYFETRGFPSHFVEKERYLCDRDFAGSLIRDSDGNPVLECMCGNVICERFDPSKEFFTEEGSFWTNRTTELLTSTTEKDRQSRTRDRCNGEGYESVALIPLRSADKVIGLLQLNDHRKDQFTLDQIRFFEKLGASIGVALARQQAKQALWESEERYRAIFEQAADSIVLHDPETAAILDFNDKAHESLGYTRKEFAELRVVDIDTGETAQSVAARAKRIAEKGIDTFETKHRTKSGEIRDVQVNIQGITIRGRRLVQAVVRDVTEIKEAERALRESEEQYRTTFENTGTAMVMIEGDTTISLANSGFMKLSGYSREEIEGKMKWTDFVVPEDLEKMIEYHYERRRDESKAPTQYEFRFIARDGSIRAILLNVNVIPGTGKSVASLLDITERKQVEEALQKSEEEKRLVLESTIDLVVYHDRDQRVIWANRAACDSLGMEPGDLVGRHCYELWHRSDKRCVGCPVKKALKTGESHNAEIGTPDGRMWLVRGYPVQDEKGQVTAAVEFATDITERKLAQEELEASRQQMRALSARVLAAQEEERTRISREIHDELAQALTALRFDLTSLRRHPPKNSDILAGKLRNMDDRIGETIRTVQRISAELRPGMLDDLGLVSAIEWYSRDFQERTGIKCGLKVEPEDFTLDTGRSTTIFRIFQEALTNVARHASATRVRVNLQKSPEKLLLKLTDNGQGITARQASSGKSLGLTGMRERARLWNGSVTIKGTEGKGTHVLVEIPLSEASADGAAK